MNDKKKFEKTKKWIVDHQEGLAVAGMVTAIGAVYGGLVIAAFAAAKKQEEKDAAALAEVSNAVARGATVLPGPEGGYWIIENQG